MPPFHSSLHPREDICWYRSTGTHTSHSHASGWLFAGSRHSPYCTPYLSINWSKQAPISSALMQKKKKLSHGWLFQDSGTRDRQNFGWNSSCALIPDGKHVNIPTPPTPPPSLLSPPRASFDVPTLINSSGPTDAWLTRDNRRDLNRYISPDITVAFLSWQR